MSAIKKINFSDSALSNIVVENNVVVPDSLKNTTLAKQHNCLRFNNEDSSVKIDYEKLGESSYIMRPLRTIIHRVGWIVL